MEQWIFGARSDICGWKGVDGDAVLAQTWLMVDTAIVYYALWSILL